MKDNRLDLVIGPIELRGKLYGYKAASKPTCCEGPRVEQASGEVCGDAAGVQRGLPVPDAYKAETPGTDSDLNAYDVIYYAATATRAPRPSPSTAERQQVQLEKVRGDCS